MGLDYAMYNIHRYAAGGKNGDAEKWMNVDGTLFDRYDIDSALYGMVFALQNDPGSDDYASSNCFLSTISLVQ
jgi:hypothetical protein